MTETKTRSLSYTTKTGEVIGLDASAIQALKEDGIWINSNGEIIDPEKLIFKTPTDQEASIMVEAIKCLSRLIPHILHFPDRAANARMNLQLVAEGKLTGTPRKLIQQWQKWAKED